MKSIRAFATLLILALLASGILAPERHLGRAAELQENAVPTAPSVETRKIPKDTNATKSTPLTAVEPVELQNGPFSVLGTAALAAPQSSVAGGWQIECVVCSKRFYNMTNRSLQLDAGGHPHVAYGGEHLYYAWHDGTKWHYTTVDKTSSVGQYASLALNELGQPHIGYYDGYNDAIKYARYDGTDWHIEIVGYMDYVWYTQSHISLALDGAGHPHISYNSGDALKYAKYDGTNWQIETVDSNSAHYVSLVMDKDGLPHISYQGGEYGDLMYAWYDGTDWHTQAVDFYTGWYISLALDEADHPHISYYDSYYNNNLKYARYDGENWHVETVDSERWAGEHSSLALDEMGHPHISYADGDILKYAQHDGTSWQIETLDERYVGGHTALALDEMGRPHISYDDWENLGYTWHDGTTWQYEIVDGEGRAVGDNSLAVDGENHPHVSYDSGGILKYARYDGTHWDVETVDDDGNVGSHASLALDKENHPHISYFDGYAIDALKYARYDGSSWHVETIDDGGGVGQYTSLALDSSDQPHISYYDDVYQDLKYTRYDGTAWHTEIVDRAGSVGRYTSLAIDENNHPHISYYEGYPNDDLKYARYDGQDWHIETVDSEGQVGAFSSLALDEAGRPHISYLDGYVYDAQALKYAWHDGVSWHIEIVDAEGYVGEHTSLALDSDGHPHISYYENYPGNNLKYAWHDGAVWHVETIDSDGDVGQFTSLAIDGAGRSHISYYSAINGDLKRAWGRPSFRLNKQVASAGNFYHNEALIYTLTITAPGLNVRLWDPLPASTRYITGSIAGTLTPPAVYSPTARAILWQGTLPTGDAQSIRFQVLPDVTGSGSLFWPVPVANTAWLTDIENNRTISTTASADLLPTPPFLKQQATPSDRLRYNETLTYTVSLFDPGLNGRLWNPLPGTMRYVPGSLSGTISPAAVYSPTSHTILWQGTLPTHTVATVRYQVTADVIQGGSAPIPIANTVWVMDVESGAVLSSTEKVELLPPLSLHQHVSPSDNLRNSETLTYTLTISGPGLNVRLWDPLPRAVRYVPGSLVGGLGGVTGTIALPTGTYSPTAHAISWHGTLPTNTVQTIQFQVTPGITGTGSLDLSGPIVNTAWLTDTESGWSVSVTTIVNGRRLYLPLLLRP